MLNQGNLVEGLDFHKFYFDNSSEHRGTEVQFRLFHVHVLHTCFVCCGHLISVDSRLSLQWAIPMLQ
jgi:hypothetical protein